MDLALLVVRFVLLAVFAVAGVSKLADRPGTRQALADFGLPAALVGPFALLLPLAELVVALALLFSSTAWLGALGALVLLLLFCAAIGLNLLRGRRPNCRCFGQIASGPIGTSTLVRNGVLALLAAFVVAQGPEQVGPGALDWFGQLSVPERLAVGLGLLSMALAVAIAWFVAQLLGQHGRLLLRMDELEARLNTVQSHPHAHDHDEDDDESPASWPSLLGLPQGTPAPDFRLPNLAGEMVSLENLLEPEKPLLLLFVDPNCGPCNALMPEVGRWQQTYKQSTIAVLSRGGAKANLSKSTEHGIATVLLQQQYEVADTYRASATPSAVVVRPDSTIASPVAAGADAIRELVTRTIARVGSASNGAIGLPAPPVKLPDLDGKMVDLADFRGDRTLMLFWNPGCGFCQQMLPDLQAWEASPPPDAPKLLVVSSGSVDENRAQEINAPIVLDDGFKVGTAFGSRGTPTAVLIDEQGNIASPVATGAQAVLSLAGASG